MRSRITGKTPAISPDDLLDINGKPLQGAAKNSRINKINASRGFPAIQATNVADDVARSASTTSKVLGGVGRIASKAAIPLAVAGSVYEGYQDYNAADQLVESGAINEETGQMFTEQDETSGKVEAVTAATGGLAGSLAMGSTGATMGAALGSIVPGVGTVIGGVVGGAIGGVAGYFMGNKAGEMIGDAATTTSGEAALEAAEDSGLYNKNWVGKSKINPDILKETSDTAQLNAILADDDLSEKDTNRVLERLSQLDGGGDSTTVAPSVQSSAFNQADESRFGVTEKPPVNQTSAEIMPNSQEAQVSVTPTADAVANMTDAAGNATTNNITNIYNTTNNNTSGGGGGSQQPIIVNSSSSRENSNSLAQFKSNGTR
jgi:gas vesicle protein